MRETYYKKVGRRYVPVSTYDTNLTDAIPVNTAVLIVSRPGCTSRRYDIDIAHAPLVAAGLYAEDAISSVILKASEMRPARTPITLGQQAAWKKLSKEFGEECTPLQYPSVREAAEAGAKAMQAEAEKLLQHPSVRAAYDHFLCMCKLTAESKND